MYFVKVESGLLEQVDFFSACSFGDLLGSGEFSRVDGQFKLSFGNVKRHFNYDGFMLDIKLLVTHVNDSDITCVFVESADGGKYGVDIDGLTDTVLCRILKFDGFIQTYVSVDGVTWDNIGGAECKSNIVFQGFETTGTVVLMEYILYLNPFLNINNVSPGCTVKLLGDDDSLICERAADPNYKVMLPVYSCVTGKISVYDDMNNVVSVTETRSFSPGDTFLFTTDNIRVVYSGKILESGEGTTKLNSFLEKILVKNCGDSECSNINVYLKNVSLSDDIKMSFDKVNYSQHLKIESLNIDEEKEIFIKITLKKEEKFSTGLFNIEIL